VVGAGFDFLRGRGVDLVVANLSRPAWSGALARHGFVVPPRRRTFAASPELRSSAPANFCAPVGRATRIGRRGASARMIAERW
jgi:hypothetical protein